MKTATLNRVWPATRRAHLGVRARGLLATTALLLAAANLFAANTVNWFSGGPNTGYTSGYGDADGDITLSAEYHTPCGIAVDITGNLYVADRDNNAVRFLDMGENWTYTVVPQDLNGNPQTNLFSKPVGVAIDNSYNLFVLNRGKGTNGYVLQIDGYGELIATNLSKLTNASGIALDAVDNIYVTASNQVIKVANSGVSSVVATITAAGASLQGIVVKHNGLLAVCDSGRNGILLINPNTGLVTTNAGFHGAGDFYYANNIASSNSAKFFQPSGIAEVGDGTLIVSDYGNDRVKAVLSSGIVTNLYGVTSNDWISPGPGLFPGFQDGTVVVPDQYLGVAARQPNGVAFALDGTIYVTEDYYHIIRKVTGTGLPLPPPPPPGAPTITSVTTNYGQVTLTWSAVVGATNYYVERSPSTGGPYTTIASTAATTYTDTSVINGTTYYYVIVAVNTGGVGPNSAEVSATPPLPPVPNPQIGYVDFPATSTPVEYTSVFHPGSSFVFNNDTPIVIVGTAGSLTYYTYGNTTTNGIPNPTSSSASAPVGYQDGLSQSQVANYAIAQTLPDLTIKAISEKNDGSPNSAIVQSRIQFVTANPTIVGNNAAQFFISDLTANAHLYYTIDGSTPSATNGFDLGTVASPTNLWTVGFPITTNTLFQVVAVRPNYQNSAVVSATFSVSNFVANIISFGFGGTQEASSDFVASPGQIFYAPVTLSPLSSATIYSLQFNLTATNGGPNPGPAISTGGVEFKSMLLNLLSGIYYPIPPYMYVGSGTNPPPPSVPNPILWNGNWYQNLVFTNGSQNLLGVGWLEQILSTNLYNTKGQDLIQYSSALNDIFSQSSGKVILGGFAFQVPGKAISGQTYQIQIGRASGTSDGIGAPGSSVIISTPTNNVTVNNYLVSALENVTIGQLKYLVGSVYPFRWFNAGDFGSSNIVDADVEQVFGFAVYGGGGGFPSDSDLFDAMDSCGNIGVLDNDPTDANYGYYTNAGAYSNTYSIANLFDGNDSTINQVAFGDGVLDVCDVYVTFRRSLDPSLTWYRRFWNNGQRVADTDVTNASAHIVAAKVQSVAASQAQVNFAAGDIQGKAGQVVQIPITASIYGSYPLRVLMLNLTVEPLDGSPALTTPVQFTQSATVLGTPYTSGSKGNGNYSAVWLNSTNTGLAGTVTLGTLTVTIPAGATANAAYAVHFDHASGSPNGLASFPKQTLTGLITLSNRTNSSYADGIPDSWRLRWFGTVNNLLSISNACPSGDGINNWMKYVAGVDPNAANDFPSLNPRTPVPSGYSSAIHWPSVSGKQYAILRSGSLFPGSWTAIATNTGTGTDMEYDDTAKGSVYFYRVQILP
jgi:hypothetical protein